MRKKVVIEITNNRDACIVVATRILDPKQTAKIPFVNYRQLDDALTFERNKLITIKTEITDDIIESLGGEVEGKEPGDGETETPENPETPVEPEEPETPVEPEEPETPVEPEVPEETEEDNDDTTTDEDEPLTSEAIDKMTISEMKEYVAKHEIEIEGLNSLKSDELKAALKEALGLTE